MLPQKLQEKLNQRERVGNLRELNVMSGLVDFSSNDYLGFSKSLIVQQTATHGATGSRLITGHSEQHDLLEKQIATFHKAPAALLFNSGYDANIGIIPALADRGDFIIYDELIHASLRDGIQLSHAKAVKFKHNDLAHLNKLLHRFTQENSPTIYIVTESVFSMDGDMPDLKKLVELIKNYSNTFLILDEAHALGVIGATGAGLAQQAALEQEIFARVFTFGKALGTHGAAVLGSERLKQYLINYARSFIYTTALPHYALNGITAGYNALARSQEPTSRVQDRITFFNHEVERLGLRVRFRESVTAINSCIIPGNQHAKSIAQALQQNGYDIRAILSPTVPQEQERLRICLHAYNTHEEISNMLTLLSQFINAYE